MFAIDVNTSFGALPSRQTDYSLATLARLMESHGIGAALTHSLRAVYDDHVSGNEETLAACRADPRLMPVAVINPRRGIGLADDIDRIRAGGFRAVRFYASGYSWGDWKPDSLSFQRILDALAPIRLPVIAPLTLDDFAARLAKAVAEAGLPLVLVDIYYRTLSEGMALAQRYPQVYIETSHLAAPGAIDLLAREIGVERILYGSGIPANNPQPSMNVICESSLTAEQKAQILMGNAPRLFGLGPVDAPAKEAAFRAYGGPKIDVHAHIVTNAWSYAIEEAGVSYLLRQRRRLNIEHLIASSWTGIMYDIETGNREVQAAIEAHPELHGYVVVNANDIERSCAEMDKYFRLPNWLGVKVHSVYTEQPTAGRRTRELFAEIAQRGRPVLIHIDGDGWADAIRSYALAYPHLPIIIAHGACPPALIDLPNVYFEFCSSRAPRDTIAPVLAAVGPERLLFGSDQNCHDPAWVLGQYYDAGLAPEQEEMIMYSNAKRLFGL